MEFAISQQQLVQLPWNEKQTYRLNSRPQRDHPVWPWPWPWPWIFKVKYGICYISVKNGPIATKQKANISIELQASNGTFGFDLGHDLDLEFSRSNKIWNLQYLSQKWSDYQETKNKHFDWTLPMTKKMATVTAHWELTVSSPGAHGEFTVSSQWPKWSQPAVTEPWPGPWLSCDLAVIAVIELWPSLAVTEPWSLGPGAMTTVVAVSSRWAHGDH